MNGWLLPPTSSTWSPPSVRWQVDRSDQPGGDVGSGLLWLRNRRDEDHGWGGQAIVCLRHWSACRHSWTRTHATRRPITSRQDAAAQCLMGWMFGRCDGSVVVSRRRASFRSYTDDRPAISRRRDSAEAEIRERCSAKPSFLVHRNPFDAATLISYR